MWFHSAAWQNGDVVLTLAVPTTDAETSFDTIYVKTPDTTAALVPDTSVLITPGGSWSKLGSRFSEA